MWPKFRPGLIVKASVIADRAAAVSSNAIFAAASIMCAIGHLGACSAAAANTRSASS